MKQFFSSPWTVFFALLAVVVLMAASAGVRTRYNTSAEKAMVYNWTQDTTTNAGNDTLTLASELQTSNWYGTFQADGRQLSGTQLIAVIVQSSCFESPASDQWDEVTRDTLNGSLEQVTINLSRMGALHYRFVMDGAGTQSTEWDCVLNLKKD